MLWNTLHIDSVSNDFTSSARDTTPNGKKSPYRVTISRSGDKTCKMLKNVSHPGEKFENLFGRQKPWAVEHFECHIRILRVKKPEVTVGQHIVTIQNFEISMLTPCSLNNNPNAFLELVFSDP